MTGKRSSICDRSRSTMQMDMLRCKTPELVRKEIWTHVLAYNLIRTVMAQAAAGAWDGAAVDQLQGDAPDPGGVPAGDRQPGGSRPRPSGVAVPRAAPGDRRPPRRRSPRPLRAARWQSGGQGLRPPDEAAAEIKREMLKRL